MLWEELRFPKYLQIDRMGFSQKLQIVAAIGLLSVGYLAPVKVINGIRNKIAHKLDYVVTVEDEKKLRSTLPKGVGRDEDGSPIELRELLCLITVIMDLERQERAFERKMRMKALANVRVVLDKIRAV